MLAPTMRLALAMLLALPAGCADGGSTSQVDAGRDAGPRPDAPSDGPSEADDAQAPTDAALASVTIRQVQDPDAPGHVPAGSIVRIEGAVVAAVDTFDERGPDMFHGDVWVADPAGGPYSGLHVYMPAVRPCAGADALSLGDVVVVEGRVQEFAVPSDGSGRTVTQIVAGTVTCTAAGDGRGPAAARLEASALLADASAEPWEGVLVELEDLEALADPDVFGALPLRDAPPLDDDLYRHPGSIRDTFVRVRAIFHYMHGRWALYPRAASDLELGPARTIEWELGAWGCADEADGDGDGAIDCADADCAASRFCRGPRVRVQDLQDDSSPSHPAPETDVTLAGELVVTAVDTFEEMPGSAYVGTIVVQDPTAADPRFSGVHVFVPAVEPCAGGALVPGDRVYVAGRYREYADPTDTGGTLTEIASGFVSCRAPGLAPAPTRIATPSDLANAATAEPWEGVLVEIVDVTVTMPPGAFGRFVVTGGVAVDDAFYRASVVLGDRLRRVAGVLGYAFEHQLEPRSAADVEIAPSERDDASCGNGADDDGDGAADCLDLDCCRAAPCAGAVSGRRLLLSEVLYDPAGAASDDGREWVELRNAGSAPVPLSCYAIGNGSRAGYRYSIAQLPAITVPAGGCVVVGGPDCSPGACTAVLNFMPDLLNGPTMSAMAAGVALLYGPLDEITDASVPVDAVIYGGANDGMLLDASGAAPAGAHVADAPSGQSIARAADGSWTIAASPSPGTCTTFTPP